MVLRFDLRADSDQPITILAFLAIFAAVGLSGAEATLGRAAILVLGIWVGSLVWWLALCFSVGFLVRSFEPRHLAWINRGSGVILLVSGAALLTSLLAGVDATQLERWR
jgi:threonine/homoserine/homoserine lactone efflux protein